MKETMTDRVASHRTLSSVALIADVVNALVEEYRSWRRVLRWLSGRTIQFGLLEEGQAEIYVAGSVVTLVPRWISRSPDLRLETDRKTFIRLIEGREVPSQAVFSGALRVAGPSDDLVRLHDVFLDVIDLLPTSPG